MKIIDFERYGNVVRFYYGDDDCSDYWGDDWDDISYEHNAERVSSQFIKGYVDIAVDMDSCVMEPKDDWRNEGESGYSKDDMKQRRVPCIIVVSERSRFVSKDEFSRYVGSDNVDRIYFGDNVDILDKYHILKEVSFSDT